MLELRKVLNVKEFSEKMSPYFLSPHYLKLVFGKFLGRFVFGKRPSSSPPPPLPSLTFSENYFLRGPPKGREPEFLNSPSPPPPPPTRYRSDGPIIMYDFVVHVLSEICTVFLLIVSEILLID
jgi:hypothetical protein